MKSATMSDLIFLSVLLMLAIYLFNIAINFSELVELIGIFFFLNQQFITQCIEADRSSYFRNYIHGTQTNRGLGSRKEVKKEDKRTN